MKRYSFHILTFIAISLFITACEHNPLVEELDEMAGPKGTGTNNDDVETGIPCDPDTVYFVNDIQPILNSNCAFSGCHGDGSAQEGVDLTSYNSIINTAKVRAYDLKGSDLYEVITERDDDDVMPPSPANRLNSDQIDKIAKWIQQGAKNNSCQGCDTSNVSFNLTIAPIIQNNCQGCHSGGSPSGGILLTGYPQIEAQALTGKLYGAVNHSTGFTPMPYNQARLSQCKIDQIRIWIENGALED